MDFKIQIINPKGFNQIFYNYSYFVDEMKDLSLYT